MAKYVYNENEVQTFNSAIGIIFGDNVRNKIETSIHKADEKEHNLMVTYDDLIRLWNYGVENGVEGYKEHSCEKMKKTIVDMMNEGKSSAEIFEALVDDKYIYDEESGKRIFEHYEE